MLIFIFSFLLLILLLTTYLIKRKDKDIFSKTYIAILITTIINIIFVALLISLRHLNITNKKVYFSLLARTDLWFNIILSSLILLYSIFLKTKDLKNKKIGILIIIMTLFVLIFMLPIKINTYNITGLSSKISFISLIIITTINLIFIIINEKNNKKYIPITITLLLLYIVFITSTTEYYFAAKTISITLINYIMYFFVENPDYKFALKNQDLKDQALDKNEAKTEYLTNISYKMRTPLNAIIGLSQTIYDSEDLTEIHKDAQDLITASSDLQEIIGDTLNISNIEKNKLDLTLENYNLCNELKNILKIYQIKAQEKNISIKHYFDKEIPEWVKGDKNKLKEIISYTLSNCIENNENSEIDFRVISEIKDKKCNITISIQDTGKGIEKDKLKEVFTTKDNYLFLVKKLIALMNGKIDIQSNYGNGTKITIYLTQEIFTPSESRTINPKKPTNLKDKSVLIVDDNALNIKVAQNILKQYEFALEAVSSGQECLAKIKGGKKYDLIFMDDMMPGMSGTATLKNLQELPEFNSHVIVLTANATEDTRSKYLESGFEDYLSKPINKEELDRILKKYLNNEGEKASFEPLPKDLYEISSETIEKFK